MTAQPHWSDSGQGDLLELVAMGSPATGSADAEWGEFVRLLKLTASATLHRRINPNVFRRLVRDKVAPRRIGAFTNRALAQGLVEYTGEWEVSDDTTGRNSGKPCRVMRWIGGAL